MLKIYKEDSWPDWVKFIATDKNGETHGYAHGNLGLDKYEWGFSANESNVKFIELKLSAYSCDWKLSKRKVIRRNGNELARINNKLRNKP